MHLRSPLRIGFAIAAALAVWPAVMLGAGADDERARIVESTLKDLSGRNEAAASSNRIQVQPSNQALDGKRADVRPEPPPAASRAVAQEVSSSLHRLRRETASSVTADGRQARVNESLDRAAERAASDR